MGCGVGSLYRGRALAVIEDRASAIQIEGVDVVVSGLESVSRSRVA